MKTLSLIILGCLLMQAPLHAWSNTPNPLKPGDLIVCGDDKIRVFDGQSAHTSKEKVVWSWQASDAKGQLPTVYFDRLRTLDDCKPVRNNTQLLITSSSGATLLVDIVSKRVIFYAHTPNAHSADLLPGGRIAIANSTHPKGNSLELYDERWPEHVLWKDTLYSGHGAVWLSEQQELVALGFDSLMVYGTQDWDTDQPRLERLRTFPIPDESGHELSQTGKTNRLLVSTHHHVWIADILTGDFVPFQPLKDHVNVKSANYNVHTGALVYTIAEESWWTFNVYGMNPDFRIEVPDIRAYKVRVVQ